MFLWRLPRALNQELASEALTSLFSTGRNCRVCEPVYHSCDGITESHNALRAQGTTRFCHYQQVLIHNDVINVTFYNDSRKEIVRKGWGRQMAFIRGCTIELWSCSYFKVTAMTECCLNLRSFKTSWCLWVICPVARMCHTPCFIFIAVSSLINPSILTH